MNERVVIPLRLRLERVFQAAPEEVFDAWTAPEVLLRWWSAGPQWQPAIADVDLRNGGGYRLSMRNQESGAEFTVSGSYTEVARPRRLAFTWTVEGGGASDGVPEETLVTVDFTPEGEHTRVILVHEGFVSEASRAGHDQGWLGCLESLDALLGSGPENLSDNNEGK